MLWSSRKTDYQRVGKPIIRDNYVGEIFMKNGLLYWKHQETKTEQSSNQLVVPKGLQQQVIMTRKPNPLGDQVLILVYNDFIHEWKRFDNSYKNYITKSTDIDPDRL